MDYGAILLTQIEEAFSQGIETTHPDMPIFKMTELQVADVIVYLQSIQKSSGSGQ